MKGYHIAIEQAALDNKNFRKVLYTSHHLQLVLMSLQPGEEIGFEVHKNVDQFFRVEQGSGKCIIDDHEYEINNGDVIIVPAGSKHNIINTGEQDSLKLYTIYSPPNHKDGTVHATRSDAAKHHETFDGVTTETVTAFWD